MNNISFTMYVNDLLDTLYVSIYGFNNSHTALLKPSKTQCTDCHHSATSLMTDTHGTSHYAHCGEVFNSPEVKMS